MENILSFAEVANIAGVHINMDTPKENSNTVHMQDRHIIHFRACVEGMFHRNLDNPSMFTNPINTSVNTYSFLSIAKETLIFHWFWS